MFTLVAVSLFHYEDWDLRFFPVSWDFFTDFDRLLGQYPAVAVGGIEFLFGSLYSCDWPLYSPFLAFFVWVLLFASLFGFAWMRIAFLAGGNAVVRSVVDRCDLPGMVKGPFFVQW